MSLFLSSLPENIGEDTIRAWFVEVTPQLQAEHIKSITLVPTSKCAFVNFTTRDAAVKAAQQCSPKIDLGGKEVRVTWGRSKPAKKADDTATAAKKATKA